MRKLFRRREPMGSDYSGMFRSVRTRRRVPRPSLKRWQWTTLAVVLVVFGLAGGAVWYYFDIQGAVQDPGIGDVDQAEAGEPFNVLLVGSDSRRGLTEQEQLDLGAGTQGGVTGARADTLILAHVDPQTNHITMVQFPRDLLVPIEGQEESKINSALTASRSVLVRTVEQLIDLEINNYIQVDIAGFRDLIDEIGGVEVCVPQAIPFDENTGLEITADEVGMVHFNGDDALRFVRSRNFPSGDFARIQNQQKFLAAAIDKVLSIGTLFDLGRLNGLIDVARNHLTIDSGTSLLGAVGIAQRFRSFDPTNYEAYTAPNLGTGTDEVAGSVVLPDYDTLKVMSEAIARNESPAAADGAPDVDPTTIRVGIYNGSGKAGAAGKASRALSDAVRTSAGTIQVVDTANASRFGHRETIVRYSDAEPEAEIMGELLAAAIPGARLEAGPTESAVDVAIIVGKRFRTRRVTQIIPIPLPKPGQLPEVCRTDA